MNLTYFKRYRMEIDLTGRDLAVETPSGYRFQSWNPALLEAFAEAKFHSFRNEIDANVFPCLGELAGCRRLMDEITQKPGFLSQATWLATYTPAGRRPEHCGTIQGVRNRWGNGSIQNVAVTPGHRDAGLGTCLLLHALQGFRTAGATRVFLEVTSQNEGAIRLYRRVGFTAVKTVFKSVEAVFG